MASKGQKALSGAASGAGIGTAILPGWGTAIGAVGGGLIGLLQGDDPEYSLDPYLSPNFGYNISDLFPEEAKYLQQLNMTNDDLAAAVGRIQQGPNLVQQRQMQEAGASQANQMANLGMAGTPIGINMMEAAKQRMMEDAQQQAFQQYLQGQQMLGNARLQGAQVVGNQEQALRQLALQQAQAQNAYNLNKYQTQLGQSQASNQMYSGLMGAGMNMLGRGAAGQYGSNGLLGQYGII